VNNVAIAELVPQYSTFMKKLIVLLTFSVVAVFGLGRFNLGETGAMRFLAKMEALMNEGKSDEVCAMFHDDLEVDIADHSGESTQSVTGGKADFCELTRKTVAGLQLLPHSMNVEFTDVQSKQQLTNPWTGAVSYSEHRTFTIPGANVSLNTVSEDEITLVQTFSGVKLRKLKSQVFRAETT
jgi:hypothetical protein